MSMSLRHSSYEREDKSSYRNHDYSHQHRRSRSRSRSPHISRSKKSESKKSDRRRGTGWDRPPSEDKKEGAAASLASSNENCILNGNTSSAFASSAASTKLFNSVSNQINQNVLSNISLQAIQNKALCRIYVGSLDYYITELEIKQVFQAFGSIVAVDMPKEGNRSKGFCFIEYTTPEAASLSLKTMQGFILKGRALKVGRPTAVGAQINNTPTMTNGLLGEASQAGMLAAVALMNPKNASPTLPVDISSIIEKVGNQAGAGAAAVAALGASAAAMAIAGGGTLKTPGEIRVEAGKASPALSETTKYGDASAANAAADAVNAAALISQNSSNMSYQILPNRIYVGNIPLNTGVEDIKKIFSVFGNIHFSQLINNPENSNSHRGYGFIEYTTAEEAQLAIKAMNKFEFGGRILKVNYATALRSNPLTPEGNVACNSDLSLTSPTSSLNNTNASNSSEYSMTNANKLFLSTDASSTFSSCCTSLSAQGSRVIQLRNMVSPDEIDEDLKEEIHEECSRYGEVETVKIVCENSEVVIFVCFKAPEYAAASIPNLHGRWFGGRQIDCKLYDEHSFFSNILNS